MTLIYLMIGLVAFFLSVGAWSEFSANRKIRRMAGHRAHRRWALPETLGKTQRPR